MRLARMKPGRTFSATRRLWPMIQASADSSVAKLVTNAGKAPGNASHGPDQTEAGGKLGQVEADATDDSGGSDSGGLPGWVAPVAIAVLFVGAGGIALARRKSSGGA